MTSSINHIKLRKERLMHDYHPNRLVKSHEDAFAHLARVIVNIMAETRTTQDHSVTDCGEVLHRVFRIKLNEYCRRLDGGSKALKEQGIEITSNEKRQTEFWVSIIGIPYSIHVVAGTPTWQTKPRKNYANRTHEITGQGEFDLGEAYPHGKMFIEVSLTPDPFECQVHLVLMTNYNKSSSRENEEIIGIARIDELELKVSSLPIEELTDEDEFRNIMMPREDINEAYDADTEQKETSQDEQDTRGEEGTA